MKSTARLERPEEIEVTITLTMPLAAWKLVRRDLVKISGNISEPARQLSSSIAELVVRTEQTLLVVEPETADLDLKGFSEKQKQAIAEGRPPEIEIHSVSTAQPRRRPVAGAPA